MDEKKSIKEELSEILCDITQVMDTISLIADGISYRSPLDTSAFCALNIMNEYLQERIKRLDSITSKIPENLEV